MLHNEGPVQYAFQPVAGVIEPCANCGKKAQVASRLFRLVPKSVLSMNSHQTQIQGDAQAMEGYSLCLYCLRREVYSVENGQWKLTEVINGELTNPLT